MKNVFRIAKAMTEATLGCAFGYTFGMAIYELTIEQIDKLTKKLHTLEIDIHKKDSDITEVVGDEEE